MQDPPATDQLLDALAAFLSREVLGAVGDPAVSSGGPTALQFRVRIAAHLCAGLAREARAGLAGDRAHLEALAALLPEASAPGAEATVEASIRAAERDLAEHLRAAPLDEAAYRRFGSALLAIAGQKVAIGNPRFDRSDGFDKIE